MILSCRHWWNNKNKHIILRISIIKKLDQLKLQFLVVSLNTDIINNTSLLKSYYNNYLNNRNNIYLLKNISGITEKFKSEHTYSEIPPIIKILKSKYSESTDDTVDLMFQNNTTVSLYKKEIEEIINFINGFYNNYHIIESMLRLVLSNNEEKIKDDENKHGKNSKIKIDLSNPPEVSKENEIDDNENEYLMNLPFVVKQFIVHLFLNYYIYLKEENEIKNGGIYVYNPFMIISKLNQNYESMFLIKLKEIIQIVLKHINLEIANHSISLIYNKLVEVNCDQNKNESIKYILILQLFLFGIVKVYYTNKESYNYVINNLTSMIKNENNVLSKFLNFIIEKKHDLQISIKNLSTNGEFFDFDIEKVNTLIKEYEHLKPIDEETFVKTVLKELKDEPSPLNFDIKISTTKIIDIDKIKNNNNKVIQKSIIVPENLVTSYDLLNYKNDSYLTDLYKEYLEFLKDETKILVKINDENIDSAVKSIYKTFPLIKKFMEQSPIFTKKISSTLLLYIELTKFEEFNNLCKTLLNNRLLLIIIFQIFIPYFYHKFEQHQFYDNLI